MDQEKTGLSWLLANLEEVCCVILMGFMVLLGFANVVTRYLGYSLAYTEELLVSMMVWITLLGAAVGFKRNAHLGLTFIRARTPVAVQKSLEVLSLLLILGTLAAVVYIAVMYHIPDEIAMDTRSQALDIPTFWYTLALPIGGVSIVIRAWQASSHNLKNIGKEGA